MSRYKNDDNQVIAENVTAFREPGSKRGIITELLLFYLDTAWRQRRELVTAWLQIQDEPVIVKT